MKKWIILIISLISIDNLLAMSRITQGLRGASRRIPATIRHEAPKKAPVRTFINGPRMQAAKQYGKSTLHKFRQGIAGGALVGGTYGACNWVANKKDALISQLDQLSNLAKDTYIKFRIMMEELKQTPTPAQPPLPQEPQNMPEQKKEKVLETFAPEMTELEKALFSKAKPDYEKAQALLNQGANPNDSGLYGSDTPLGRAIKQNDRELIEFLLNNGADINQTINTQSPTDNSGTIISGNLSALALAITQQSPSDIIELLINKSPNLSYSGLNKTTPLLLAIDNKNYNALDMLLTKNMRESLQNSPYSPLYAAAANNDIKAFKMLVDAGLRVQNITKLLNTLKFLPTNTKSEMINYYNNLNY